MIILYSGDPGDYHSQLLMISLEKKTLRVVLFIPPVEMIFHNSTESNKARRERIGPEETGRKCLYGGEAQPAA